MHHRIHLIQKKRIILFLSIFSLANALLFGFFSSFPDMHIRYALPSYISFLLMIFLLTINFEVKPCRKSA